MQCPSGINGHEDSKVPSEKKKSVYPGGVFQICVGGGNKETASTTPNFL